MNNFQDTLPNILNIIYDCIVLHEIHGFPDASLEAYGSCVYLKTIGKIIPEPLGILLFALSFGFGKSFASHYNRNETLYRIDGSVCLSWFKNTKKQIKNAVQYRVNGVRGNSRLAFL